MWQSSQGTHHGATLVNITTTDEILAGTLNQVWRDHAMSAKIMAQYEILADTLNQAVGDHATSSNILVHHEILAGTLDQAARV